MTRTVVPDKPDNGAEPEAGSEALGQGTVRSRVAVAGRLAVIIVAGVIVLAAVSQLAPRPATMAPSTGPTQLVVVIPQRSYGTPNPSRPGSPVASPSPLGPNDPWGGLVWSDPAAGDLPWRHVPDQLVSWNGRYVGMDYVGTDNTGEVVVASSTDLANWTVLAHGGGGPFPMGLSGGSAALMVGPAGLVAIGPYGVCDSACTTEVWTSTDGTTWKTAGRAQFSGALQSVAAGPNGIVILGSKGFQKPVMWHSANGIVWNSVDLSGAFKDATPEAVKAVPSGFIAVGGIGGRPRAAGVIGDLDSTAAAWWSKDGLTWSAAPVGGSQGATALMDATVMSYGIVATGKYQGVWISTDGRAWAPLANSDTRALGQWSDGHHDIAAQFGDPNSVGAQADQFWGSVDGRTWRPLTMTNYPAPFQWYKVFVTAGGVVALAGGTSPDDYFVVSAVATR